MTALLEWTFAYGSNMDVDDVCAWFVAKGHAEARIQRCERATLFGYRLIWNYYSRSRRGGAANVERIAGATLPGLALQVNAPALAALDLKEGHPRYYARAAVPVALAGGASVTAWLYVAVPARCRPTTVPPTCEYLNTVINAAERNELPAEHIEMLRSTPTAEPSDGQT